MMTVMAMVMMTVAAGLGDNSETNGIGRQRGQQQRQHQDSLHGHPPSSPRSSISSVRPGLTLVNRDKYPSADGWSGAWSHPHPGITMQITESVRPGRGIGSRRGCTAPRPSSGRRAAFGPANIPGGVSWSGPGLPNLDLRHPDDVGDMVEALSGFLATLDQLASATRSRLAALGAEEVGADLGLTESVRLALHDLRRPDLLAASPLIAELGCEGTPAERGETLRALLLESIGALIASRRPTDSESGRVLDAYYVKAIGSHEAVAERLCMSRATLYRRHRRGLILVGEAVTTRRPTSTSQPPRS